jgi:hypothetical protein
MQAGSRQATGLPIFVHVAFQNPKQATSLWFVEARSLRPAGKSEDFQNFVPNMNTVVSLLSCSASSARENRKRPHSALSDIFHFASHLTPKFLLGVM